MRIDPESIEEYVNTAIEFFEESMGNAIEEFKDGMEFKDATIEVSGKEGDYKIDIDFKSNEITPFEYKFEDLEELDLEFLMEDVMQQYFS